MTDRCQIPRCRAEAGLTYLGHGICDVHWNQFTAEDAPTDKLRMVLGIETDAPTAKETPMETTETVGPTAATTKTPKAKSKGKTKTPTGERGETKATKAKTPKQPKPPKERAAREDLVVFALRLTLDERQKLHAMAGPGKATRVARAVLSAAANRDLDAFKAAIAKG